VIATTSTDAIIVDVEQSPNGPTVGAFFDFDGTIIDGYSVAAFYEHRLKRRELGPLEILQLLAARLQGTELSEEAFTALAEQAGKAWAGRSEDEMDELGRRLLIQRLGASLYREAWEIVQAHRRKGHTVVLASAATKFQLAPMAADLGVEHILCTPVETDNGVLTGRLAGPPLWGPAKAKAVAQFAADHGVDLDVSYGYANGGEDLAFLQTVGHPIAVNPQRPLAAVAAERQWPVAEFAGRPRPNPVHVVRNVGMWSALAAGVAAGTTVGLLNRNRRQGLEVGGALASDLALAVAGVQLDVQGAEHLWSPRPAVFVFNHQSGLDAILIQKLVRQGFSGVVKKEAARMPGFGQIFRLADVAFVDRGAGSAAKAKETLAPAVERLRQGLSLVIAPEGTRSATPRLGPFKKGAFHIAMQAGVPVVPIVIRNAGEVAWRTSLTVRPGTIDVVVLPQLSTKGWTTKTLDKHVAEVRQRYLDTLENWPQR
jgi:HAD superfamily hydrolase (TIGR01490 family)